MAQVKDNPITQGASGKLGNLPVFHHTKDGRTIVLTPKYPQMRDEFTIQAGFCW